MNEQTAVTVAPTMMALTGISKNYDGVAALTDVDLIIGAGEVHALLGENGAGKSALVGVASGAIAPDGGVIAMGEDSFARLTPAQATDLRITIVHQHPAVLPDMTVAENIRVAVPASVLTANGDVTATMRAMLDDVGFTAHLEDRVGSLNIAQKSRRSTCSNWPRRSWSSPPC